MTIPIYRLQEYTFEAKEAQTEDQAITSRFQRLQAEFEAHGMRKTVEAIFLVHEHRHIHVLMFQIGGSFFKLPGGSLEPGEDEEQGLRRLLSEQFSAKINEDDEEGNERRMIHPEDWEIIDVVSKYYRPNYENNIYPYIPTHISRPKEEKKQFLIALPKKKILTAPSNLKTIAVPLFELYDNSPRYGLQLASLPHVISRFDFKFEN